MKTSQFRLNLKHSKYSLFVIANALLVILVFATIFPSATPEQDASATIDIDTYGLTLVTNTNIELSITPTTSGSVAIAKDTVIATTAAPGGYKLYLSTVSESDNNIYLNGNSNNNTANQTIKSTLGTFDNPLALNIDDANSIFATWGYAVAGLNNFDSAYNVVSPSSSSKFAALPTSGNEQLIRNRTGAASSDITDIYYGVKAGINLVAGDYETEITYTTISEASSIIDGEAYTDTVDLEEGYTSQSITITTSLNTTMGLGDISVTIGEQSCANVRVVSNNPAIVTCDIPTGLAAGSYDITISFSGPGKTYIINDAITIAMAPIIMQTMTPELCASLELERQYKFIDNRDNKIYWAAKLADGNCWMTQNLDLDLDSNITLTSSNTDLNSVLAWTPERDTIASNNLSSSTWTYDHVNPYSYDPGDIYYYTSNSSSDDIIYNSLSACISDEHTEAECRHYHTGNYYNWSAAVAENDSLNLLAKYQEAPDSICPKGWRLWRANHSESEAGELSNLISAYNLVNNTITSTGAHANWADGGFNAFRNTPLFFNRIGYIISDSVLHAANTGYYWSSTNFSTTGAYYSRINSAFIDPQFGYDRNYGFPVRCVARESEPTLADITYMQEMTPNVCAATETPLATTGASTPQYELIDSRDNKTYFVAKLADGRCWMTQNLDLDLDSSITLTSADTDLNLINTWAPENSTVDASINMTTAGTANTITTWNASNTAPYSVDPGNVYFDNSNDIGICNYLTTECDNFKNSAPSASGRHSHIGNYYNWSAAVASNDTSAFITENANYRDSICPKGWRLPNGENSATNNDYRALLAAYGDNLGSQATIFAPFYYVRSGWVHSNSSMQATGANNYNWSSTVSSSTWARGMYFTKNTTLKDYAGERQYGFPIRCVAREPEPERTLADIVYMQEMTHDVCATTNTPLATEDLTVPQYQLIDNRDNKIYFVAKLADDRCWMTQNLDLDLNSSVALTNEKTDFNTITTWTPENSTISPENLSATTWENNATTPYSYDAGDVYYYTSNSSSNDISYNSLLACTSDGHTESECKHYSVGNYYNFTAASTSNSLPAAGSKYQNTPNSICPKGWRLWQAKDNTVSIGEMSKLVSTYEYIDGPLVVDAVKQPWSENGFNAFRSAPFYVVRSGLVNDGHISNAAIYSYYYSSTFQSTNGIYLMAIDVSNMHYQTYGQREYGRSVRCIAY